MIGINILHAKGNPSTAGISIFSESTEIRGFCLSRGPVVDRFCGSVVIGFPLTGCFSLFFFPLIKVSV